VHWAYILLILAIIWFLVYILGRLLKLDEKLGWTFGPLFLLMRTKRFNNFIMKSLLTSLGILFSLYVPTVLAQEFLITPFLGNAVVCIDRFDK